MNVEVQGNGTVQVHSTQEWISRVTAEGDHGKHSRDSPLYINAHRDEDIEVADLMGTLMGHLVTSEACDPSANMDRH